MSTIQLSAKDGYHNTSHKLRKGGREVGEEGGRGGGRKERREEKKEEERREGRKRRRKEREKEKRWYQTLVRHGFFCSGWSKAEMFGSFEDSNPLTLSFFSDAVGRLHTYF